MDVVALDEFGEGVVGLQLLHAQHVGHGHLAALQLQLPVDEFLIDLHPVVGRERVVDLHADSTELLLIAYGGGLRDNDVLMNVLFDG